MRRVIAVSILTCALLLFSGSTTSEVLVFVKDGETEIIQVVANGVLAPPSPRSTMGAVFLPLPFPYLELSFFAIFLLTVPTAFLVASRRGGSALVAPPAWRLLVIAECIYSRKTYTEVFEPIISDLREEYDQALIEKRGNLKLFFILVRGYWTFWAAAFSRLPVPFLRVISKLTGG